MHVLPCFECFDACYEQNEKLTNCSETRQETTREKSINRQEEVR